MQELRAVIYANLKEFGICSLGPVLLLGFQVGIAMLVQFNSCSEYDTWFGMRL